jgi:hypothetical protein
LKTIDQRAEMNFRVRDHSGKARLHWQRDGIDRSTNDQS